MALRPATATVQEDNDRVRVTEWHLPPGSETGAHVHEMDYVIVPVAAGTLTIYDDTAGQVESPLTVGQSYFRRAGVSHNVTNQGESDIRFIEIELKPERAT